MQMFFAKRLGRQKAYKLAGAETFKLGSFAALQHPGFSAFQLDCFK
jgi:hypothetical protein